MKLHELSTQITNTISDIHHKKYMQKPNRKLYHIDKEEKEKKEKKKEVLKDHEKNGILYKRGGEVGFPVASKQVKSGHSF